jgi:hypothetical protein
LIIILPTIMKGLFLKCVEILIRVKQAMAINHYFAAVGNIDESGKITFYIDIDNDMIFFEEGTIFDSENDVWQKVSSSTQENDMKILQKLQKLFNAQNRE